MSKGSGRRPPAVSEAEIAARWERTFGKTDICDDCGKPLNGWFMKYTDHRLKPNDNECRACRECAKWFG